MNIKYIHLEIGDEYRTEFVEIPITPKKEKEINELLQAKKLPINKRAKIKPKPKRSSTYTDQ